MNYPIHMNEIRSAGIRAAMRDAGQVFARLVATGRSESGEHVYLYAFRWRGTEALAMENPGEPCIGDPCLRVAPWVNYEILGEMEMIEIGDDGCWHISPTVE